VQFQNGKIFFLKKISTMGNATRRENICDQPEIIFLVNSVVGKGK
jgi:hypothetical protein